MVSYLGEDSDAELYLCSSPLNGLQAQMCSSPTSRVAAHKGTDAQLRWGSRHVRTDEFSRRWQGHPLGIRVVGSATVALETPASQSVPTAQSQSH